MLFVVMDPSGGNQKQMGFPSLIGYDCVNLRVELCIPLYIHQDVNNIMQQHSAKVNMSFSSILRIRKKCNFSLVLFKKSCHSPNVCFGLIKSLKFLIVVNCPLWLMDC